MAAASKFAAARIWRPSMWEAALAAALLADVVFNALVSPYFLDPATLSDATFNFTEKALVALPLAMLIMAGEIDISVAGTMAIASVAMGFAANAGADIASIGVLGIMVGAACGALNGLLIAGLGIPSIVATIGTMSLFRGAAYAILGDRALSNYPPGFEFFGQGYVAGLISFELVLFAVAAGVSGIAMHATSFGRRVFAIGANPIVARYSGVPVRWLKFWLLVLVGAAAGAASLLLTSRIGSTRPSIAQGWELEIISMVILGGVAVSGGKGSILGVALAAILIGFATFGLSLMNVPGIAMSMAMGVLLIAVVAAPNLMGARRD